MINELIGEELKFHISYGDINKIYFTEEEIFYKKLTDSVSIKEKGFNIFIIDDYGGLYLDETINRIKDLYKNRSKAKDICYALINKYETKSIVLPAGSGYLLQEQVENIKSIYKNKIFDFYNSNICEEKENIIKKINQIKNDKIEELIKTSDELNFQVKTIQNGFTFIPLKNGELLTEINFNQLEKEEKSKLLEDVDNLKNLSKKIIDFIDEKEKVYINDIKLLFQNYLNNESKSLLDDIKIDGKEAIEYLSYICSSINEEAVNEFSLKYDEDYKYIEEFIDKFMVKVIIDNKKEDNLRVIYEDKPSLKNLFGKIEYETKNSSYITDISMFTAGTLIKANEGCLIMNINDILFFRSVYYYLKKTFLSCMIDFKDTFEYSDILPLKTINLDSIPINEKLILIGDYNSYSILKDYDEEFSKIFSIALQVNPYININPDNNMALKNKILNLIKDKNLLPINDEGISEIFRCFSRKIEDKDKLFYKYDQLKEILIKAGSNAAFNNKGIIEKEDIIKAYRLDDIYEDSLYNEYLDKKILLNVNGTSIGEVNGLSVIQTAVKEIGRPIKITCSMSYGEGKIYDIHKESNLSGKIHTKSIAILKGYLNTLIGSFDIVPYDFHLNFEQVYSMIDGDSASVAEIIAIISTLCKIGVNQNIAVTGSINQFGMVLPIGGVNEKIEGFYKVCSLIDSSKDKGVLIPKINRKNLVLDEKIIDEIEKGNFHIYTMETLEDAAQVLLNIKSIEEVKDIIKKKYKKRKSR